MQTRRLREDERAADKVIVIALASLLTISVFSALAYMSLDDDKSNESSDSEEWIDPVVEIEDEFHSHSDLLAHRLQTSNMKLIDYHNLNCDGNVAPPAELDNVAGRQCFPEFKNVGPTPGDSSEISIEGNFMEDCEKRPDGTGGCYAYVSSYNQFEILDISEPNNIVLLSTYYAEVGRMIDIKVTPDNNWVLVNHELTNSDLDPIPQDDDANSGANRLDVIDVSDKNGPIKVAEWNNPPAGFHNQDLHVKCDWDDAPPIVNLQQVKKNSATSSSMAPTLTPKWLKAIQELSTKERRCSMFLLVLNHGGLISTMMTKTPAVKSFAGAAILPNLKPPAVALCSTTTMCSTSIPSLAKPCSTFRTGMQACALLTSQTPQPFLTLKASLGLRTTKSAGGSVARAIRRAGTALMVADTPT